MCRSTVVTGKHKSAPSTPNLTHSSGLNFWSTTALRPVEPLSHWHCACDAVRRLAQSPLSVLCTLDCDRTNFIAGLLSLDRGSSATRLSTSSCSPVFCRSWRKRRRCASISPKARNLNSNPVALSLRQILVARWQLCQRSPGIELCRCPCPPKSIAT